MMQFWEDDADTTAVGLYLESIGNPRKFSRIARRLGPDEAGDRGQVRRHGAAAAARPRGAHHAGARRSPGCHDAPGRRDPGGDHRRAHGRRPDRVQPAAARRGPDSPSSATPGRWAKWWRTAPCPTDWGWKARDRLDLDAGMSRALPALRPGCSEVLAKDAVHAAVVALLPARGLTVEKIAGVLRRMLRGGRKTGRCRLHRHPGSVGVRRGHGRGRDGLRRRGSRRAVLLQPGSSRGGPRRRRAVRPVAEPRPGPVHGT